MNAIIVITGIAMLAAIPLVMHWDKQQKERDRNRRD